MLAQVQSFMREKKWIVFLGWSPHSMNEKIAMTYLTGSTDETFGPNDGTATVYTNVRKDYTAECPNLGRLLQNLTFSLKMENEVKTPVEGEVIDLRIQAGDSVSNGSVLAIVRG